MNKQTLPCLGYGGTSTTNAGVWTSSSQIPYNNSNTNKISSTYHNNITNYFTSSSSSSTYSPSRNSLVSHSSQTRAVDSHFSGEGKDSPPYIRPTVGSKRTIAQHTLDNNKRPCLQQSSINRDSLTFPAEGQHHSMTDYDGEKQNLVDSSMSPNPESLASKICRFNNQHSLSKVERVRRVAKHKMKKRDKPPSSSVIKRPTKVTRGTYQQDQHQLDQISLLTGVSARTSLPRDCKMKAISTITSYYSDPPEGAFRLPKVKDCPGVIVTIAKSSIPSAGLGLFLVSGPAEDHSVPPGTIIATYDGIFFKTQAERDHVKSEAYRSNYVWEGLNPFNGETIMVDGKDKKSYGPFINDGLSTYEANTEIVVGNDGKLYVKTTTWVNVHNEFFMSYGGPFWLDPINWALLPRDVQLSVLQHYNCKPPIVTSNSNSICNILSLMIMLLTLLMIN